MPQDKLQQVKDTVAGGVVLGQPAPPENPYLVLEEPLRMRVAMDITANTLLAEARNMLMRAGLLYTNDSGAWVDEQGNLDLGYRCKLALKVLEGTPLTGADLAQGVE